MGGGGGGSDYDVLSKISKTRTTSCLHCFLGGYKHKFNYYMRTIPCIGKLLKKVDEVILTEFIVAITRGILITEMTESCLLSLAP